MSKTGSTLHAFVDLKDPFMNGEVAGETVLGPILSILSARHFNRLQLFYTPQTSKNADSLERVVRKQYPDCDVILEELAISDPKEYSSVMGRLARKVREIVRCSAGSEHFVCVSSGTAEMRAAWFLLAATGLLPAKLLQVGSPAQPLFGAANVKEVPLSGDWNLLRDLVMPVEYFRGEPSGTRAASGGWAAGALLSRSVCASLATGGIIKATSERPPRLDDILNELQIFVGSAVMRDAAERAEISAVSELPVLLSGETGTGKELFARLIHRLSPRYSKEMTAVNCAAIPKELAESYLFGHLKGAFTGADRNQKGIFEQASEGTLFLDEIGELSLEVQAKLLRVLENKELQPLGAASARPVDVRVVAATNRDLKAEVKCGRFRDDLYYRLEVVNIHLPPLRERRSEIATLALVLLKRINQRRQRPRQLSKYSLRYLEQYGWPGNVRELSNVLERSVLYARTDVLEPGDLQIQPDPDDGIVVPEPVPGFCLDAYISRVREKLFSRALEKAGGNQSEAAKLLGVSKQAVSKFTALVVDNQD